MNSNLELGVLIQVDELWSFHCSVPTQEARADVFNPQVMIKLLRLYIILHVVRTDNCGTVRSVVHLA